MINRNELLKNFTIGFIPILAFIVADQFYGPRIGIIVAIIVGAAELAYYFIRYRRIEKFVLFDTFLIVLMGGISLLLHNDLFFKLKPALIEAIIVILFAVHAFSKHPVLLLMGQRYMKGMEINTVQADMMRRMSRLLFFVLLIHTLLIVYSAWFWSREAWAFVSGGLFYIVLGVVFIGQLVYARLKRPVGAQASGPGGEEWFDLVNEQGRIIGKAPRSKVHGNPALLHPTVHLHVFNRQGKLYLQKRSARKDLYPGLWDTAVGGHVSSGESIEAALRREADEELGIKLNSAQPLYRYIMKNNRESELVHTFRIVYDGPITVNAQEIETGRFWSVFEIQKTIGKGIFTPNFEQEFGLLKKNGIV